VQPGAVTDPFTANYLQRSRENSDARAEKREERGVDTVVHAKIPEAEEVEAAFAAYREKDPKPTAEQARIYEAYQACLAKTATAEQKRLVNGVEDRAVHEDWDRQHQSSRDRIIGRGHVWEGWRLEPDIIGANGISMKYDVAGHLHLPFVKKDLFSRESGSRLMLRCVTMTAKPKRAVKADPEKKIAAQDAEGPRTGMTKDGCRRQRRRIVAHDDLYWFFNDRCVDAWRHDDDETYPSEAHLGALLDHKVEEGTLAVKPNASVYVWDDRWPEKVPTPHHYYWLPDDGGKLGGGKTGTKPKGKGSSAVWKDRPGDEPIYKNQHHMLDQIQAKLNEQLGCDPGGLANMNHGKNPLSVHVKTIIWHENCLTLTEFAELLDLDLNRQEMARKQMVDALQDVGFDDKSSNNSHTVISKLSRSCTRKVAKAGIDTDDYSEFLGAAIEATTDLTKQKLADIGIAIPPGGWKAVEKLIEGCCRWAVADFDPAKLNKSTRNTGCAKHLMLPTDDKRTRQIKGQAVGAANRGEHSDDLIAEALDSIESDGVEPTISEIARRAGRSRDTVSRRVFAVHLRRIAEKMLAAALKEPGFPKIETGAPRVSIKSHVWGAPTYSAAFQPSAFVIAYARQRSDLPNSWQVHGSGIDWHDNQLRLARTKRQKLNRQPAAGPPAGRNVIDFLSSGRIKVFRSAA
jgi:hypothetical protein